MNFVDFSSLMVLSFRLLAIHRLGTDGILDDSGMIFDISP